MHFFLLLVLSLVVVVQAASLSSKYAERIAESFHLSRYLVGFIVVSFVAILPETFIAINAAIQGVPSLGIGTIFGSNVIDLTLIFAILIFIASKRGIYVEKSMTSKLRIYPLFLSIPLLLGFDGMFERSEGLVLIIVGVIFYYYMFRDSVGISSRSGEIKYRAKNVVFFIGSMALLLLGAHFTSLFAVSLATELKVSPILVGVLIVSFGTTLPELFFSIKAVKNRKNALAIGDVLGSVLADATIVVGIIAMIAPFKFPQTIAYIAGGFMVFSAVLLIHFMRSRRKLSHKEAIVLVLVWVVYVFAEILVH
ncbi:sodium:calcium antiporter [Candidatus Saccharibacteria bacterium]|nr:sodium:calcium antiporter [Candidatus Saccharibacteria bacterium]